MSLDTSRTTKIEESPKKDKKQELHNILADISPPSTRQIEDQDQNKGREEDGAFSKNIVIQGQTICCY